MTLAWPADARHGNTCCREAGGGGRRREGGRIGVQQEEDTHSQAIGFPRIDSLLAVTVDVDRSKAERGAANAAAVVLSEETREKKSRARGRRRRRRRRRRQENRDFGMLKWAWRAGGAEAIEASFQKFLGCRLPKGLGPCQLCERRTGRAGVVVALGAGWKGEVVGFAE